PPTEKPRSAKSNLHNLSTLTNIPIPQLQAGMQAWNQLYEAVHTLGLPHSENLLAFHMAYETMGLEFPFYEQYMITTGRAGEIISANPALARIMGTRIDDPDSLHEYRRVERLSSSGIEVAPAVAAEEAREILHTLRGLKEGLKGITEQLLQEDAASPGTLDAGVQTASWHQMGARILTDPETRVLNFVIGLFLLLTFFPYDPNEIAGSAGLGRYFRVVPTMITLLEGFYAALGAYGVGDGGILLLLMFFVVLKCLEQGLDME
ncbi:MAG: hypothetical protein Q9188_005996, partial [Gyalolechia gomerana]